MAYVVHGCVAAEATTYPFPSETDDVEVVTHGDVAALVTRTDEDEVLPTRSALLTHTGVLERAADRTTVVPMRFGVVAPDADALVATFLGPEHDRLVERLRRLDGQVEFRLRGRYDEPAVLRRVVASDRRTERLRGAATLAARMELGERIAAGIDDRRAHDTRRLLDAVEPYATEVAAGPVTDQLDAFVVSVLVDRQRTGELDRAIAEAADGLPHLAEIEVVGPLPPFSFASDAESR